MSITLAKEFKIHYISNSSTSFQNRSQCYGFSYNNNLISLYTVFKVFGLTRVGGHYIPVWTFGYSIGIKEWNEKMAAHIPSPFRIEDGRQTKDLITDPIVRNIIVRFVLNYVNKMVTNINPDIIVRGPINEFKQTSTRYLEFDKVLSNYYKNTMMMPSIIDNIVLVNINKDLHEEHHWVYSRFPLEDLEIYK